MSPLAARAGALDGTIGNYLLAPLCGQIETKIVCRDLHDAPDLSAWITRAFDWAQPGSRQMLCPGASEWCGTQPVAPCQKCKRPIPNNNGN